MKKSHKCKKKKKKSSTSTVPLCPKKVLDIYRHLKTFTTRDPCPPPPCGMSVSVYIYIHLYVCVCVFSDQCTEFLRWISTGDPRRVNFDLHHLLHVGRWRLTSVELPAWPSLRDTQEPTQVKLTSCLTPARHWQEDEEDEEERGHGGLSVGQTTGMLGSQISTGSFLCHHKQGGFHGENNELPWSPSIRWRHHLRVLLVVLWHSLDS